MSGGVSANSGLRERFNSLKEKGFKIFFPEYEYSTDNAAMIGLTGYLKFLHTKDKEYYYTQSLRQNAKPKLEYDKF